MGVCATSWQYQGPLGTLSSKYVPHTVVARMMAQHVLQLPANICNSMVGESARQLDCRPSVPCYSCHDIPRQCIAQLRGAMTHVQQFTERLAVLCCAFLMPQGEGLQLLLNEGAEKNSWPKSFAATHKFKSDPVIPLPDVTMVDFDRELDEFLVVATDGLWDCMPPAEAIRYAR